MEKLPKALKYADIIVPLAVDGAFTYAVPEALEGKLRVGGLVVVPFAGNKQYTGLVGRMHDSAPSGYKVKAVEGISEEGVCLSEMYLKFLRWMADYYMARPGEVLRAALPVMFRLESYTEITLGETEPDWSDLSDSERAVLRFLRPDQHIAVREIEKCLGIKSAMGVVKSLLNRGYVRVQEAIDELFRDKTERWVGWKREFKDEELHAALDSMRRAPAQYKMLCEWIAAGEKTMEKQRFLASSGGSAAVLKALCEKGILQEEERRVSRLEEEQVEIRPPHPLSQGQAEALAAVRKAFQERSCVLMHGVTSSGKTEVYIHLINEYVAAGKQVLYLLPEIALTVQIVRRLKAVFGNRVGIYHSGMPDAVRTELWRKQAGPDPYPVILGVRSSLFLPFRDLGLVIVDEEHDASYKQHDPAPRYHGRDAAVMLAHFSGAKVLLGSATPALETFHNAQNGKYGYVRMDRRYGDILMPEVEFADVAEFRRKKLMKGVFSPTLVEEMRRTLADGKQVILFQNRRGYSTYLQCGHCGAIVKCDRCDVSMTYYKHRDILSCRYCGSVKRPVDPCPECGEGHYMQRTPGTERVEEEVARLFPDAVVARMDLEVMGSKSKYRKVISDLEEGKTDILVGTQMVAKGLDFERVRLVGVVDADSMANFPDFRSEERAYCMLTQVSGRCGRKGERGKVVIQTADKDSRVCRMLCEGSYEVFYAEIAEERRALGYPPFTRLIEVELRHREVVPLRNAANALAVRLRKSMDNRVWGPAVPVVGRIGLMNRVQLLIKMETGAPYADIKRTLKDEIAALLADKGYSGLRATVDVDPM